MNENKSTDSGSPQASDLRQEAEQRLRNKRTTPVEGMAEADVRALLHELQVHQIKLEMQNEELLRAQEALRETSDKYQDLFDFSPIGYFLLCERGEILEANLAGAALLGLERSVAVNKRLGQYVAPQSRSRFAEFCDDVSKDNSKQTCEIVLQRGDQRLDTVMEGIRIHDSGEGNRLFRVTVIDVTDRKRMESADRLPASIVELSEDAIIAKTLNGSILTWNAAAERIYGYAADEVVGKSISTLIPPEQVDELPQILARLARGERIAHYETVRLRKDGTRIHVSLAISPLVDKTGRIAGAATIARDVTERKRMEDALRESEERFRAMAETVPDMLFTSPPDGRNDYVSPRFYEYTGFSPASAEGDGWTSALHPDDREPTQSQWAHAINVGGPYEVEARLRAADGSYRWFLARSRPVRDASGRIVKWFGACSDIDDVKQADQAVRQSHDELQAIYDGAIDGLLVVDIETKRFVRTNPAMCRMLGYSDEELLSTSVNDIHPPDTLPAVLERFQAQMEGRLVVAEDSPLLRKDGTVMYADIGCKVLVYKGRLCGIGFFHDITERVLARRRIEQLADEARQAAKELERSNRDLDQFASVASHDLKEPLRTVIGFVQLLQQKYKNQLGPEADQFIEFAVDGARRMETLIKDLLAYARVGSRGQELAPTDAGATVRQAIGNLSTRIHETAAEITCGELPTIRADNTQLVQLFQNLLSNALKFRGQQPPKIHVDASRNKDHWQFTVRDNGIGIAPESLDRIFLIFERLHTRTQYPGTGIGLAICKRIVERHGGTIWVESQPGEGAAFHFTIPI